MKLKLLSVKATLICTIILSMFGLNAGAQEVIGLQKAVDLALERNLTIKQAQFTAAITEEDLKQSKNNQLPNLSVSPQTSFNFGRNIDPSTNQFVNQRILAANGNFNSQVTLYQGGQLRNTIIQNKILLDADRTNVAKVKNDLILNVVTTYLLVLTNQDLVTAAQQQIDISKIALDRAQKNFDVGNQTLADLSQAKAQVSTNELNYTNAENQLEQSLLTLKQYMEMDPATDIKVERPDISKLKDVKILYDPQDVVKTATAVNPDVILADQRQKAAAQGIKIAQSGYYPSVVLFGAAGSYFSDAKNIAYTDPFSGDIVRFKSNPFFRQISDNFNQTVGLSLQIPIFNRFTTRTAVRKAKLQNQNAEVTAQLARNNLSKIIYQAVWDLQAADKRYQSATQTYNANKAAFNTISQRYTVGLVNSLDYNTSQTNLNKSQFDMIEAQYQVIFRSKVIDYYLGNPITL
ncbi:TolC family protein [Mucilaginibacter celer]|uniref:TolC family protein n=1 Tax=Mucilaginibacter celer TaxID=2305508 RepID=A0A494W4J6_9SPHI|nr:TolC family protein [Mucilaginibacter celer]AYL98693.1 TolC family protein [Mucilaginibacter celer]